MASTTVDRRRLALLVVPIILLVIAANVGTALAPTLVVNHPVWLLVLDSRNRHLLLVAAAGVDPVPFFVVGFFRLLLSDPLFFLLGRSYGQPALRWAERRLGSSGYVAFVERAFAKVGPALVAIMPNNLICLLAGTARMRVRTFFILNAAGTVARLALIWWLGGLFEEPLDAVLRFIQRYQWWLVAASVLFVVIQATIQQRKGEGELETVERMAEELEEAADELEAEVELDHVADELGVPGAPIEGARGRPRPAAGERAGPGGVEGG
ncbi:MAG: VTT domain-containing protein [Acidimicrobiales bacterium]|nr:VTT domain-containing protein [Acidimicrobiales bacterium]